MTSRETLMEQMANVIRAAMVATSETVQVEPRMVLFPSPPTVDIYPGDLSRDPETAAFGDVDGGYVFTVRARVSTADTEEGQTLLLKFSDDENELCLPVALLDEPTLNGYAADLDVRDQTGFRLFEHPSGEGAYLGFQFTAMVIPAES